MSVWDGIGLAGAALVALGLALIYLPLALVAVGIALVAVAILGDRSNGPPQPPVRPGDQGGDP